MKRFTVFVHSFWCANYSQEWMKSERVSKCMLPPVCFLLLINSKVRGRSFHLNGLEQHCFGVISFVLGRCFPHLKVHDLLSSSWPNQQENYIVVKRTKRKKTKPGIFFFFFCKTHWNKTKMFWVLAQVKRANPKILVPRHTAV